jgi:hypothetical protein
MRGLAINPLGGRTADARHRSRVDGQAATDGEHLLFAPREGARVLPSALLEDREDLVDVVELFLEVVPLRVRTHLEVLPDGHLAEQVPCLGDVDEPLANGLSRRQTRAVGPEDFDPPVGRSDEPRHGLQQRRLARAVGADQRDDSVVGPDGDRDVPEHLDVTVAGVEVLDDDTVVAHASTPPR